MNLNRVHHVAIIGSDYEKSKHFYVDLLGFQVIRETYRAERRDHKIDLQLDDLNRRLKDKQLTCTMTDAARDHILDAAYDPQFGARPLRRYVQRTVETLIARRILAGDITPGSALLVDAENGSLTVKA